MGSLMSLIVYIILTKALLLFTLLLRIAYVELMVGEMEACTCVTYIAKSNKGSMEMTNHTSWSRLCTCVEGGWWNEILLLWISLSFIWITWGHGYIYFFRLSFFSWTLLCPFVFFSFFLGHASWACHLFSFFLNSSWHIWRILERERSFNMEFYSVDGWNGIADFQCRSSAGGVHVILIKHVWKTSH